MIYKNAEVFYEGRFQIKDVRVEAGVITAIGALGETSKAKAIGASDEASKTTASGALEAISKAMAIEALDKTSKAIASGALEETSKAIASGALDKASKAIVSGVLDKISKAIVMGALDKINKTTTIGASDEVSKTTASGALEEISKAMATEALDRASKVIASGALDRASKVIAVGVLEEISKAIATEALDKVSKITTIGTSDEASEITASERLDAQEDSIDLTGYRLIPGVIDVHTHGCLGYDFSHITPEGIEKMEAYYKQQGVTSILATVMTSEPTQLMEAVRVIREYQRSIPQTIIKGIHLEGPFYGEAKKGAHESRYLKKIDQAWFERLDAIAEGQIKLVSIDPTLEGASDFIRHYKEKKTIALGHTDATYAQAKEAVACGARQITHLFNAMNGLHHREPGLFGVLTDEEVYAELITDGVHVHPSVVKMCFNANPEKLLIISDSISAAGLKEGERCISGGVEVMIKEGKAVTQEGTLAGSTYTGYEVMRQAIEFGVNEAQAIQSASQYPAQAVGLKKVGKIDIGYHADLLIVDQDYNLKAVIQAGECENKIVF